MNIDTKQLSMFHGNMHQIIERLEETGIELTITSLHRPGDSGIHGTMPLRAIDFGCHDQDIGNLLARLLNVAFVYDPSRPEMNVAIYHDVGRGAHLHVQCHDRTMLRR